MMAKWLNMPRRSFQVRLFVSFLLIIFCFIPSVGYLSYLQGKRSVERQIEQYSLATVKQVTERVRSFLLQHKRNVRFLKSLLEQRIIDPRNRQALLQYFRFLRRTYPSFVNIYYGDRNGRFMMVPPQRPEIHKLFDPRERPWYRGAAIGGDLYWTGVYVFASSQKPGITASVPVLDSNATVLGVCGIDIDLSTLSGFLRGIKIGKRGYSFIIENSLDRIIAHPGLIHLAKADDELAQLSSRLKALKHRHKKFGTTLLNGERYFTAYADFPEHDWTIGLTLPISDFLQDINRIKQAAVTMTLLAILIASVLSLLIARTVIRPLTRLEKGIKRISSGNLEERLRVESQDVIGSLAESFNQMAESLKESREQVKRTYMELAEKERMAALGQLTAGIAHEIKNPLGIILSSAQIVNNDARPREMRKQAGEFIIQEVKRLNKTINTFLDFAKPAPPRLERCDLIGLLDETIDSFGEQFSEREIVVSRKYPKEPMVCEVDRDQVRQVFLNLFINAVQAMPRGGTLEITAVPADPHDGRGHGRHSGEDCSSRHKLLQIDIKDSGEGIDEEVIDKIFDPFFTTKSNGTGLGLPIVYRIMEQHRARMMVSSIRGEGTVFSLVFRCSGEVVNGS